VKLASQGKVHQLESIIQRDKSKLHLYDKKERGLLHHATRYGQQAVMDFLLGQGAGWLYFACFLDQSLVDTDGSYMAEWT
jgi:hypothetical protein